MTTASMHRRSLKRCFNIFKLSSHLLLIFSSFLCIVSIGTQADKSLTNIGAIVNVGSYIGKEEKIAMKIAVENFNNGSKNHKLALHYREPGSEPLATAAAAEDMIKNEKVGVIVGMERWEEAALVADIGSQAQVPVISFSEQTIAPSMAPVRWPFLIRMDSDAGAEQIKCIAALVYSYNWRRVIIIYEQDSLYDGGELGKLTLLYEALQRVGSEIEYRLVLPSFSLVSDPKEVVRKELVKVMKLQSRAFIVLKLSLPMTTNLFREAKDIGLMERDSAWIVSNSVTGYLDLVNSSVISSMEGALGIKNYYSEDTDSYRKFYAQFKKIFRSEYPEEDHFEPGVHALKAYDTIKVISKAIEKMENHRISNDPKTFLNNLLSSYFTGLSGEISFKDNRLLHSPPLRIVNVVGKKYKELNFWLPEFGFSEYPSVKEMKEQIKIGGFTETRTRFSGPVVWPGDLTKLSPKGWTMPTAEKPMRIGVPKRSSFEKFVTFEHRSTEPTGFCIDLFKDVLKILNYSLPHVFVAHEDSYDDLVMGVYNKTYDAAVGDITILAERTKYVEFTQPYTESGLSLIVPAKAGESAWMFLKPFSFELWAATGAVFIYTTLVVWFMEHRSNPDFGGPLKNQFSNVLWFIFSSIFFAHKDKIYSNTSRVVVVVWLFVVFILTSSYTASLSSRLTVKQLEQHLDIKTLHEKNLTIGCDEESFVKSYLMDVLDFKESQISTFDREPSYIEQFERKHIAAGFLELPYERIFIGQYCKKYTSTNGRYRFGGFGFAFQKGSPIAADFSKAILELSENGMLKDRDKFWFSPSRECAADASDIGTERLSLHSFWTLYILSISISTLCLLIYIIGLLRNFQHRGSVSPRDISMWSRIDLTRVVNSEKQRDTLV